MADGDGVVVGKGVAVGVAVAVGLRVEVGRLMAPTVSMVEVGREGTAVSAGKAWVAVGLIKVDSVGPEREVRQKSSRRPSKIMARMMKKRDKLEKRDRGGTMAEAVPEGFWTSTAVTLSAASAAMAACTRAGAATAGGCC